MLCAVPSSCWRPHNHLTTWAQILCQLFVVHGCLLWRCTLISGIQCMSLVNSLWGKLVQGTCLKSISYSVCPRPIVLLSNLFEIAMLVLVVHTSVPAGGHVRPLGATHWSGRWEGRVETAGTTQCSAFFCIDSYQGWVA